MGFFDDVFGFGSSDSAADSGFGGLFGGGSHSDPAPLFGSDPGEPILPFGSQARGYGGSFFGSVSDAEKSSLMDSGVIEDPDTGYVGTPREIYDRYLREGRSTKRFMERFRKNKGW